MSEASRRGLAAVAEGFAAAGCWASIFPNCGI